MSQRSFPFDDVAGDRQLDTVQWARHTAGMVGNGVVSGFASELEVVPTAPESLAVDVSLGRFWVEGRYFEVFSAAETVTLATADPTDPRIDRIVVRRSIANREVTVEALTGTPAVSPDPPALTQSPSGDWEESLAQIAVAANETVIAAADITDERSFALGAGQTTDFLGEFTTSGTQGLILPITPGRYKRVEFEAEGDVSASGEVRARVGANGEISTTIYRSMVRAQNASGTNEITGGGEQSLWLVGHWRVSFNYLRGTLHLPGPAFSAQTFGSSGAANASNYGATASGGLTKSLSDLLDEFIFLAPSGQTFTSAAIRGWGYR